MFTKQKESIRSTEHFFLPVEKSLDNGRSLISSCAFLLSNPSHCKTFSFSAMPPSICFENLNCVHRVPLKTDFAHCSCTPHHREILVAIYCLQEQWAELVYVPWIYVYSSLFYFSVVLIFIFFGFVSLLKAIVYRYYFRSWKTWQKSVEHLRSVWLSNPVNFSSSEVIRYIFYLCNDITSSANPILCSRFAGITQNFISEKFFELISPTRNFCKNVFTSTTILFGRFWSNDSPLDTTATQFFFLLFAFLYYLTPSPWTVFHSVRFVCNMKTCGWTML